MRCDEEREGEPLCGWRIIEKVQGAEKKIPFFLGVFFFLELVQPQTAVKPNPTQPKPSFIPNKVKVFRLPEH